MSNCSTGFRGVVTALKPVRAEQVKRPERKQNRTVPHCGPVLPICLSLRPVGPIHIIIETFLIISCSPRADVGGPNCQSITPLIIWNIFIHFLALSFNSVFYFLTEAAQYECSYRRTAHHATDRVSTPWLRQLSLWVFKMIFLYML